MKSYFKVKVSEFINQTIHGGHMVRERRADIPLYIFPSGQVFCDPTSSFQNLTKKLWHCRRLIMKSCIIDNSRFLKKVFFLNNIFHRPSQEKLKSIRDHFHGVYSCKCCTYRFTMISWPFVRFSYLSTS
jgi:hypothetical protein